MRIRTRALAAAIAVVALLAPASVVHALPPYTLAVDANSSAVYPAVDGYLDSTEISGTVSAGGAIERIRGAVVITIGGRSAGLRKAALEASKRIGKVEVDYGDTACKTPGATEYIEKAWAHAKAKGFASPAAQERARELPRLRC